MTVTPADVATTLGRSIPALQSTQYKQWALWIEDARRIIKNRLPDLDALDQGDLDYVVREAVAERARKDRKDSSTSKTVKVDDGEVTTRYPEGQSSGIEITDEWWEMLDPEADSEAFTVRPWSASSVGRC